NAHAIETSPRKWLMTVIKNQVKQVARDSSQELFAERASDLRADQHPVGEESGAEQDSDSPRDLMYYDAVLDAVRALSPSLRIVAQMYLLEKYPLRDIAEALHLSPDTVRQRLFRARRQLRGALAGSLKESDH